MSICYIISCIFEVFHQYILKFLMRNQSLKCPHEYPSGSEQTAAASYLNRTQPACPTELGRKATWIFKHYFYPHFYQ